VINTAVVALAKWLGVDNPFLDLLVTGQVIGFSIMLAVSAAGNLNPRRIAKPIKELIDESDPERFGRSIARRW